MKKNSIKKDIKILETFLDGTKCCNDCYIDYEEVQAIKHILSGYKRLQKENELAKQSLIKNSNIADERNNLLVKNQELKEVIAKMAEYIASKDIDEDVCKKVGHSKYCEEYGEKSNCKECVIEFFKGEVNK